jgi:hypothetical protein
MALGFNDGLAERVEEARVWRLEEEMRDGITKPFPI